MERATTRVIWICHEATAGQPEAQRTLTSDGSGRARAMGRGLHAGGFFPGIIITSSARYAVETVQCAFGAHSRRTELFELYFGGRKDHQMHLEQIANRAGTLEHYHHSSTAKLMLNAYAEVAAGRLSALLFLNKIAKYEQAAIIGHAILLPAVAHYMTRATDKELADRLLRLQMSPGQTIQTEMYADWNRIR